MIFNFSHLGENLKLCFISFLLLLLRVALFGTDVDNTTDLITAIENANGRIDTSINITSAMPGFTGFSYNADLLPLNVNSDFSPVGDGDLITIQGNGYTLTADNSAFRGFFATGNVAIYDLTIASAKAQGGIGGQAEIPGGGGGGLGGGLFIDDGATVTLSNVSFTSCEAEGGAAGPFISSSAPGGGGGMQGEGGSNSFQKSGGGGGGGFYGNGFSPDVGQTAGGGGAGSGSDGDAPGGENAGEGGGNFQGGSQTPIGGDGNDGSGGGGGETSGGSGGVGGKGGGGGGGFLGNGGNGGFGGGGGGASVVGQTGSFVGGDGGFGGGGGGGYINGGKGGFGGGAGAGNTGSSGGFGGGSSAVAYSTAGGGAGLGGAIFIRKDPDNSGQTTTLTIEDSISFSGSVATGGNGSSIAGQGGSDGQGIGRDIFMMSGSQVCVNLSSPVTIPNPIESDQGFAGGTGGGLTLEAGNSATLTLSGANTYTGTTIVNGGELEIAPGGSIITDTEINSGGTVSILSNSSIEADVTVYSGGDLRVQSSDPISSSKTLTFQGGTINVLSSLSLASEVTLLPPSTVVNVGGIFNVQFGEEMTLSGVINGAGGLRKTGDGMLDISGATSSYGGILKIDAGRVVVGGASDLGAGVDFDGGRLQAGDSFATTVSQNMTLSSTGIIETQSNTVILNGVIEGAMGIGLTKEGTGGGHLVLKAVNTYTGPTTVSNGTLSLDASGSIASSSMLTIGNGATFAITTGSGAKTINFLSGSGTVNLNDNPLILPAGSFDGAIQGTGGSLIKTSTGLLLLTGNSDYSGGTTLLDGTLQIGSGSSLGSGTLSLDGGTLEAIATLLLGNPISVDSNAKIAVDGFSLVLSGVISGAADLEKTGSGRLRLQGNSPSYSGTLTLSEGVLTSEIGSVFSGQIVVKNGTRLVGNGVVGTVTNEGIVFPGASIGTLSVDGDYTQAASGRLLIEIASSGENDLLDINGQANLDGDLQWIATPGIYRGGDEFTFLTTTGGINGAFSEIIEFHSFIDATVIKEGNSLVLKIASDGPVPPVSVSDLCGNPRQVADYLFCSTLPPDEDLVNVMDNLVHLSPGEFVETLPKLSPVQMWALPLTVVRNDTLIASFDYNRYGSCCDNNRRYLWVTPLTSYYKQEERISYCGKNERKRDISFDTSSKGVSVGHIWMLHRMSCGLHADYLYSKLKWDQNAGVASLNTIYLSPFFEYFFDNWHVGVSLVGARTFYDVERSVQFGSIKRTAYNDHKSWNGLVRISGGAIFEFPSFPKNFFVCPEAAVNYLNIWESGYNERGASSINLVVQSKHSAFLNPRAGVRLIKEFPLPWGCFSAMFRVGWESFVPLSDARYSNASFLNQQTCKPFFFVEGFTKAIHQAVLGTQLALSRCDHFSLSLDYEASLDHQAYVHEGAINLFWKW